MNRGNVYTLAEFRKTVIAYEVREFYTPWSTSFHVGDYDTEKEAREVAADYLAKYLPIMGNGYRVEIYSFEKKNGANNGNR
jgi:hypothetical protein